MEWIRVRADVPPPQARGRHEPQGEALTAFRCGTVGLIGRPNAGKSTLLNQVLGGKLAITSAKPQTTRDRIVGVFTDEHMQAILVDTPGIHDAWTELNKVMVRRSFDALAEVDLIAWVVDMARIAARIRKGKPALDAELETLADRIGATGTPVLVVANKIDIIDPEVFLPFVDALQKRVTVHAAVPTSALTGDGMSDLLAAMRSGLPVGEAQHPEDEWTQVSERFLAAEIIREKIFHLTEQEVPYSTGVEIEAFDESKRESDNRVTIRAAVFVERQAQKGILIGKGGEMVKRIGTMARKDLQKLLDCRVHLELFIKVLPDWTKTARGLKRAGFGKK